MEQYSDANKKIAELDKEVLEELEVKVKQISSQLIQNKASFEAIEAYNPKSDDIKVLEEQIRHSEEKKQIKCQNLDKQKHGYEKLQLERERAISEFEENYKENKATLAQREKSLKEAIVQYQEMLSEESDTFSQMLVCMGFDDEKLASLPEDTLKDLVYAVECYIYKVFFPELDLPLLDSPSGGIQVKIDQIKEDLERVKSDNIASEEKYLSDEEALIKRFSSLKTVKKEIDDLEAEISITDSRLKNAKKGLSLLHEENIRLREEHRKELLVSIDVLEKEMSELQEQRSILSKQKAEQQEFLRMNYEKNLQAISVELNDLPRHQQEELLRVEEEYNRKLNHLEEEKNTILSQNGIDTSMLTEKVKLRQTLADELSYIHDMRESAQTWNYFINQEYPTLDRRIHELYEKEEEYKKTVSVYQENVNHSQKAVNRISDEILNLEKEKNVLETENEKQIENHIKRDYEELVGDFEISYTALNDRTLEGCVSSLSDNLSICREAYANIVELCSKITKHWSLQNPLNFPVVESRDYMGFIDKIYSYVIEDNYKAQVSMIDHTYILLLQNICREFRDIYQIGNLVQKPVNTLNSELSHVNEIIPTITSIKVKLQWKALSGLDDVLYRASEYVLTHDINTLFSTGEETERYNEFLYAIATYMDYNSREDRDYIEPSDLFCLMFACSERGNPEVWDSDINRLGSSGNTSLTKWIVQLTLLDIYRKAVIKSGNEDFRIHCMMDEIGTIHSKNMKPLIRYANERGIYLVTAVPDNIAGEYFDTCYKVVIKKEHKYSDVQLSLMHKFKTKQHGSK